MFINRNPTYQATHVRLDRSANKFYGHLLSLGRCSDISHA
ncbi:hypothetical protein RSAG8_12892, partial [Rhizoctonia solani AG-8 WAC10335]